MNKILGAMIIALAAVTLAGCSSGPDQSKVDDYHTLIHAVPAYADLSNSNLDKAGKGICRMFQIDAKTGYKIALAATTQGDETPAQGNLLVQAAVKTFCPQYWGDIPQDVK